MNCYGEFAEVYDRLMKRDLDYNQITDHIENLFDYYGVHPKLMADLACGTGNITIPLAQRGYEMIGVDASGEMLSIAQEKAAEAQTDILFLNQNMSRLDLYGTCGAFVSMIDGFNYMVLPQAVLETFRRIHDCFLDPGGLLIFDVSSDYKLREILGDHTFVYEQEDIFYTWENRYLPKYHLCSMYLNFFRQEPSGSYRRFTETHLQRGYTVRELTYLLKKAGFEQVDAYDGFSFDPAGEASERILIAAR